MTAASRGCDVEGAEALKEISPHQFEWWAVDLVNARPAKDHKKGADICQSADYINFFDDKSGRQLTDQASDRAGEESVG